jgi:hypothetical protein
MPAIEFPKFHTISSADFTVTNADDTETTYIGGTHQICIYSVWFTDTFISIVPGIYNTISEKTEPLPFRWEWDIGNDQEGYEDARAAITNEGLGDATSAYTFFFGLLLWAESPVSTYFEVPA